MIAGNLLRKVAELNVTGSFCVILNFEETFNDDCGKPPS